VHEAPDDARHKQFLFWVTYVLDKSLSLRMGRSSTIQDYDVTVQIRPPTDPDATPNDAFFGLWVTGSRLLGEVYELLYCPAAIALPESTRRARAQDLLQRLGDLDALTAEASVRRILGGIRGDGLTINVPGKMEPDFV